MRTNKQGRALNEAEKQIFNPYFSNNIIEQARIVDGSVPFWLRSDMSAVVLQSNIYFRPGVYQPNTLAGVELLGHELVHVEQFLAGLNWWKYLWSCRYGYRNSQYEVEAFAKGRLIAANFQQKKVV